MRISGLLSALLLALPAAAAPAPTEPGGPRFRAINQNLETAKKDYGRGGYRDALEELKEAEKLPGNSNRQRAEILIYRAACLLAVKPPDKNGATEAVRKLLHVDRDGELVKEAPAPVRELADELRASTVLVLHRRLVTARLGRPIRLRAEIVDPAKKVYGLFLHWRPEGQVSYYKVALEKEPSGWTGALRIDTELEQFVDYWLEAVDETGATLDQNGAAEEPIQFLLSTSEPELVGLQGEAVSVATAALPADEAPPDALKKMGGPPPPPQWWENPWLWAGAGGVVLVGVGSAVVWALIPPPPRPNGTLGRVDLP
jgi:hypothetical protein